MDVWHTRTLSFSYTHTHTRTNPDTSEGKKTHTWSTTQGATRAAPTHNSLLRTYTHSYANTDLWIYIWKKKLYTCACCTTYECSTRHSLHIHACSTTQGATRAAPSHYSLLHTYTHSYVNTDLWIDVWKKKLYTCTCSTTYTCSTTQGANRAAPSHNSLLRTSLDSTRLAALEAEVCVCEK